MPKSVDLFMIKNPEVISADLSLEGIMGKMNSTKLSHLLVNNENGQTIGVISKEDIVSKLKTILDSSSGKTYSSIAQKAITAQNLMSKRLISVKPDDSVDYAIELLLQKEFHCLPVLEDGKPVGIVTFYDLLKGYYQHYG